MSEGEQTGRCRSEVDSYRKPEFHYAAIADAIDRLAADVAAIKEAVCDGSVAEERDRFFAGWAAALNERDKLRAEIERLRAELAAPQPAAPPAGWLTPEERELLALLKHTADGCSMVHSPWRPNWPYARMSRVVNALLARAGSPPVVEVPALGFLGPMTGREQGIVLAYRDALDAAGVSWKEVSRGQDLK